MFLLKDLSSPFKEVLEMLADHSQILLLSNFGEVVASELVRTPGYAFC